MNLKAIICGVILFFIFPAVASAATLDYVYQNEYATDEIRFDIINVTSGAIVDFWDIPSMGWDIHTSASNWTDVVSNFHSTVLFSAPAGSSIQPGLEVFNLSHWNRSFASNALDDFDFVLQWAEYNGGILQGEDTIAFVDGIPTPLPASAWMLLSGLAMLVGIRRRNAG